MKAAAPSGDSNAGNSWCHQLPLRWGNKVKKLAEAAVAEATAAAAATGEGEGGGGESVATPAVTDEL